MSILKQLMEELKASESGSGLQPGFEVPESDRVTTLESMRNSDKEDIIISPEIYKMAESIQWLDPKLSWKGVKKMAVENYRKLGEATSSSALSQLLRAGVQTLANDWYKRKPVFWPDYVLETPSDKRQEFYPPLYGSQLPKRTGRGEPYSQQRVLGQEREVINYKYMGGESFERELFDDDQTGQIRQRASDLGDAMRVLEEWYVAQRVRGTAGVVGEDTIPASTFSTVNASGTSITVPFSVNLYDTSEGNRPSAYAQMSTPGLKDAYEALLDAKDGLGVKLATNPDTLLVSSFDYITVRTFLNSAYYPAAVGLAGETASSASSGLAEGAFSKNELQGLLNPAYNAYLPQGAWYLGEAKKGIIFQRRDPLEVVQELPQAGESFRTDTYQFRSRSRWEVEWIDSRFWYQGNDGSATVTH